MAGGRAASLVGVGQMVGGEEQGRLVCCVETEVALCYYVRVCQPEQGWRRRIKKGINGGRWGVRGKKKGSCFRHLMEYLVSELMDYTECCK